VRKEERKPGTSASGGKHKHQSAHGGAAGNIHDGEHGMGARRKGEELGTSAAQGKHCHARAESWAWREDHQSASCHSKTQPENIEDAKAAQLSSMAKGGTTAHRCEKISRSIEAR